MRKLHGVKSTIIESLGLTPPEIQEYVIRRPLRNILLITKRMYRGTMLTIDDRIFFQCWCMIV